MFCVAFFFFLGQRNDGIAVIAKSAVLSALD